MNKRDKVEREYHDMDGYWIELRKGWVLPGEWTHAIVEATKRQAHRKLGTVVECRCKECSA